MVPSVPKRPIFEHLIEMREIWVQIPSFEGKKNILISHEGFSGYGAFCRGFLTISPAVADVLGVKIFH